MLTAEDQSRVFVETQQGLQPCGAVGLSRRSGLALRPRCAGLAREPGAPLSIQAAVQHQDHADAPAKPNAA